MNGCFKNSTLVVLCQCQNKANFQRKDSGMALNFHFIFKKVGSPHLCIHNTANPLKDVAKTLIQRWNPFFENFLYFDISGEQQKCCF